MGLLYLYLPNTIATHGRKMDPISIGELKYRGRERTTPLVLNLDTRWRSAVNIQVPAASSPENFRYPLNKRLGGPQSQSVLFGEEEISSTAGIRTADRRTCSLAALRTMLSWLSFFISQGKIFKLA
jgi:hypothetical protein